MKAMKSIQLILGQCHPSFPLSAMLIAVTVVSWLANSWLSFWLSLFVAAMSSWAVLLLKDSKSDIASGENVDSGRNDLSPAEHKPGVSGTFARLCINQVEAPIRNIDQVRTLLNRASIELWFGLRKTKSAIGSQEKEVGVAGTSLKPILQELKLDLAKVSGAFCEMIPKISQSSKLNATTYDLIQVLSTQLQEVEKQIEALNWIADHTNLLAVNAQIEAARLGKDAKGFHVIASEVHTLADRSRSVSKEIETSLNLALQAMQSILDSCLESSRIDFSARTEASKRLQAAIETTGIIDNRVNEVLSVLAEANSELTDTYNKTVLVMQFDDITKQVLDRSYKDLSALRTTLRELASPEASNSNDSATSETKAAEKKLAQYELEAAHKPNQESLAPGDIELF